tara:strand:- start:261 stop:1439 length:1179 start_codon:yes stop_codon:yes gene_type:complete
MKVTARFSGGGKEPEEVGIDKPLNGNQTNGNGNGNGNSNGGSNGGVSEGTLHKWFKGSKSKDGKGGWVNVVTGGTCASDKPGEGTPKCVSSAKRASMSKAERLSAQRRKKKADPGQQQKSGAAKPTYVSTDPKKKMKKEEVEVTEAKDKKGKGSGTKDACYHKVKSRYSVWPSAYASGALVKCRKVGAANWGNKSESVDYSNWRVDLEEAKKCWKGYKKVGTQKLFGKTYNRCVKKEEFEKEVPSGDIKKLVKKAVKRVDQNVSGHVDKKDKSMGNYGAFVPSPDGKGKIVTSINREEFSDWREELGEDWQKVNKSDKTDGMSKKAVAAYRRENPGSKLKTAVTGDPKPGSKDAKRRKSFCARSKGQQDMHNIDCSKTPDKPVCKARRRWKC